MSPPTDPIPATPLLRTLGIALLAAWALAAAMVVVGAWAISPELAGVAVLGAGLAFMGTVAGLAALGFGLSVRGIEPGFVVLGASIFRAVAGLLCGLLVEIASDAPDRPLWLSFLIVLGVVMAVEVVVSRRVLDRAAPTESPLP